MIAEEKKVQQQQQTNCNELRSIPLRSNVFTERFFGSFNWEEFACGCGAAFVNIAITYPIYKMIFRQMLHGVPITSAFSQLRHEGLMFLYRGMLPPLAQKTISLSIMFGVFDGTRRYLVDDYRMNAYVFVHHGFHELYRGIVPVLWRNGPSNALFFILREEASIRLPQRSSISTRAAQEFIAGAVIGASISTLFYPLNVIKVAMQSSMGHPTESMWTTTLKIYKERGNSIMYFYRGCGFNTARSFISWGIMNAAYENLKNLMTLDSL
uniref:Mitochondrial carrier protein n=1 Tax=Glossina palpalis gambiensis TaxID=67801 RepID=A0A1B0BQB0_9MUSC